MERKDIGEGYVDREGLARTPSSGSKRKTKGRKEIHDMASESEDTNDDNNTKYDTINICGVRSEVSTTMDVVAPGETGKFVCLLVGCLTSQQQASVSQGRICSDNFTCCHTAIEVADQTFYLTQSQYTDTGPTSPSADPITPGAWQGSHWSANF